MTFDLLPYTLLTFFSAVIFPQPNLYFTLHNSTMSPKSITTALKVPFCFYFLFCFSYVCDFYIGTRKKLSVFFLNFGCLEI